MSLSTMSRSSSCPAAVTLVRKAQRKCGSCGETGHNARTCPQKTQKTQKTQESQKDQVYDRCLPCSSVVNVATVESSEPRKTRKKRTETKPRICKNCGLTGHNSRTCAASSALKEQKSLTTRDYHKALPRFVGFAEEPKKTKKTKKTKNVALEGLNKTFFMTLEDSTHKKQIRVCRACGLVGHNARTCAVHQAFITMGVIS